VEAVTADLVAFLRARLDEDEQAARTLGGVTLDAYLEGGDDGWAVEGEGGIGAIIGDRNLAEHIARHDPTRVLREVEAKRQIIDEFERHEAVLRMKTLVEPARSEAAAKRDALLLVLRLLALSYADHPDYRAEGEQQP
jgi:hypothetical protein